MGHLDTQFKDTRRNGKNTEQGLGGGNDTRPTTSARGGRIQPRVETRTSRQGNHEVPHRADVDGPKTAERGGHNRHGHQKHNPAEAKGNAGDPKGNDRVRRK